MVSGWLDWRDLGALLLLWLSKKYVVGKPVEV
jgi:hypothetical protein